MDNKQKSSTGDRKDFPFTALIVAEEVARAVKAAGGKIDSKAISGSLGGIVGGALARKLSSAKRWGLIQGHGMLELTELGRNIMYNQNEEELAQLRKEAFLSVPLLKELYNRFGATIPPQQTFIAILVREHGLKEDNAKSILTIYKEAVKLYLNAKINGTKEENPVSYADKKEISVKSQKKDCKVSVYISSPMGENSLKADNKEELKTLKMKLDKLFSLIEDELPINNHTGSTAEESSQNLSCDDNSDNSESAN